MNQPQSPWHESRRSRGVPAETPPLAPAPSRSHPARTPSCGAALSRAARAACRGAVLAAVVAAPALALGQQPPASGPAGAAAVSPIDLTPGMSGLKGRRVEDVSIRGNTQVSSAVIRNLVRTRAGEPFDPATVAEDYQRVFGLRKFANVEAKVEPTATGVNVAFVVTEQRQVKAVRFKGNEAIDELTLRGAIDVREGDAIDSFRISVARSTIEGLYKDKNYALARVTVDEDLLAREGVVRFAVVEGPPVRVRNVRFVGNKSFTDDRLGDQVKTAPFVFVFRSGKYSPEQVEEDVAALRKYYEGKGFFDVRVGRKLVWSPDLRELQVDFVIEEGPQYRVDKVTFQRAGGGADDAAGNPPATAAALGIPEAELRSKLKMLEGAAWDADVLQRDTREVVRAYSAKYGYIYYPGSQDPDYLRVDTRPVFRREAGKVELVYLIREGREFRLGNIYVKGNSVSQDKLVYREFRDFTPGETFNSAQMQDATERLRRLPFFGGQATVTPIGEEPAVRDLLVEVNEGRTATFNIGAGVNSNGGVGGNLVYEERNFDIANWPAGPGDLFTKRAFTGAGQTFRAAFNPGTIQTDASIRFAEPYIFDQPFSFSNDLYLRTRIREDYDDRRVGDTVTFGHRFTYNLTASVSLRGEQVKIHDIQDPRDRAPEIVDARGSSVLTSAGVSARYDTTPPGLFPTAGTITTARWEAAGALGGDYSFNKFTVSFEAYKTVAEDLLDRKTTLSFRGNTGYIGGAAPFFERFYGGGIGSLRGFQFRGVSPRAGREEDVVGGEFLLTGTLELNYPLAGDSLRGVVFVDAGTVEPDVRFGTVRSSVGAGVRVLLPFLGQLPLAIDFAVPVTKDDQDETQFISFSFGFTQ